MPDPVGAPALAPHRAAAADDLPASRTGSRVPSMQPPEPRATTLRGKGARDDDRGPRKRVGKRLPARCQGGAMRQRTGVRKAQAAALCVEGKNGRARKWLIVCKFRVASRSQQRRYASLPHITSRSNSGWAFLKEGLDKSICGLASPRRVRRVSGLGFDESSTYVLDSRAGHPWPAEALI
jgi:hypothetical protein